MTGVILYFAATSVGKLITQRRAKISLPPKWWRAPNVLRRRRLLSPAPPGGLGRSSTSVSTLMLLTFKVHVWDRFSYYPYYPRHSCLIARKVESVSAVRCSSFTSCASCKFHWQRAKSLKWTWISLNRACMQEKKKSVFANICWDCCWENVRTFRYVRISLVRVFLEGLLGSPVPMLLVARTLNSYSTQGLNLVTMADSCFPPSSSGTERHHRNNLSSAPPPLLCQISRLKVSPAADVLFTAVSCERRFKRDNSLNLFLLLPARDLPKDRYNFWGVCGIGKSPKKLNK